MKLLKSIEWSSSGVGPVCRKCAYFSSKPSLIEEVYPGLKIMSSGYASVRDQDGFCSFHRLYLSARDKCPDFTKPTPDGAKKEN